MENGLGRGVIEEMLFFWNFPNTHRISPGTP